MAVKGPQKKSGTAQRISDRSKPVQQQTRKERPVARKPGHITDSEEEEQVADPELKEAPDPSAPEEVEEKAKVERRDQDQERRKQQKKPPEASEAAAPKSQTTAGHLALDSNYYHRRTKARRMGFDDSPGADELVVAYDDEEEQPEGEALGVMFPGTRARAHPDLPEIEVRPPDFLNPMESMKDIYMKVKGRMSRRTKELIEHIDLEDLIEKLYSIFEDETFARSSEARIRHDIWSQLKDDPGPLLVGLTDPRLTELWRLFLEGWDIWVIGEHDRGVDLFWEGEAEDDDGEIIEMLQSLQFMDGEITLHTKMGPLEDKLTFDGESFYRLKTERPLPRKDDNG